MQLSMLIAFRRPGAFGHGGMANVQRSAVKEAGSGGRGGASWGEEPTLHGGSQRLDERSTNADSRPDLQVHGSAPGHTVGNILQQYEMAGEARRVSRADVLLRRWRSDDL